LFSNKFTALNLTVKYFVLLVKPTLDLDALETALTANQNFTANVGLLLPLFDINTTEVIAEVNASTKYLSAMVTLHVEPDSCLCMASGEFKNIKNFSCRHWIKSLGLTLTPL
jgi:hypothetical protein